MSEPKLNAHGSDVVRNLFEEDTNEVKTLGDVVDKHARDTIVLSPDNRGNRAADPGEEDFVDDMLHSDPSDGWVMVDGVEPVDDPDDVDTIGETDITGTAAGIARGFGSHLPLDLGKDGFQIEEIPEEATSIHSKRKQNEELDDYDDDNDQNGKFDSGDQGEDYLDSVSTIESESDQTFPPSRMEGH